MSTRQLGISRYNPRQEEVERYIEEIRQYNSIMNLQYLPSEQEIRLIVENCPVCIDGEATEQEEVSGHRNLERVETNTVRGGMALVLAEGIPGKAPKLKSKVEMMKMDGWDWLGKLIKNKTDEGTVSIKPLDKYLRDLIGGRPVFSYPMRKGGFRLRYGRSRNTGFAAAGLHPATLYILGEFLAVGTQMKTERPGKACGVVPVDSIEGPTVRMQNGDVLRIDDEVTARKLVPFIEKILDVGEILISFGEFLENNHPLIPCGYCEEWWLLEVAVRAQSLQKTKEKPLLWREAGNISIPNTRGSGTIFLSSRSFLLLTWLPWQGKIMDGFLQIPNEPLIKIILEELLIPHEVRNGSIQIKTYRAFITCLGLDENLEKTDAWTNVTKEYPVQSRNASFRNKTPITFGHANRRAHGQTGKIQTTEDEPSPSRLVSSWRFRRFPAIIPVCIQPHGRSGCNYY